MMAMNDKLSVWLASELKDRGWSIRELARRAGIAHTTIADVISGQTKPTLNFCGAIAKPLGKNPEDIARLAGLLPPIPAPVEEESEVVAILRNLAPEGRTLILKMLRGLAGAPGTATLSLAEPLASYQVPILDVPDLACEIANFVVEFPELEELMREAQERLSEPALRALMVNVRIFVSAADRDRLSFAEFHRQLSEFFAGASAS